MPLSQASQTDSSRFDRLLPFLTSEIEPLGGTLKDQPEDFIVEEIPAYHPCGEGEHYYLWVEKRDLPADEMLRRIARACEIPSHEIGSAGLKDRRGITRQYLSVPARCAHRVNTAESENLRILHTKHHTNKLRTGHLQGNRFQIRLHGITGPLSAARQVETRIREQGCPNYFGDQRFGRDRENLDWGIGLLTGKMNVRQIPFSKRKFLLRMYLSAVQSALFNLALADRLESGTVAMVQPGDVLEVVSSHGPFVCENGPLDQLRLESGEIAVTGPIFGPKMKRPREKPAEWEATLLQQMGLSEECWTKFPQLTAGTRRSYLFRPDQFQVHSESAETLFFEFILPAGVYATSLIREFQKTGIHGNPPGSEHPISTQMSPDTKELG